MIQFNHSTGDGKLYSFYFLSSWGVQYNFANLYYLFVFPWVEGQKNQTLSLQVRVEKSPFLLQNISALLQLVFFFFISWWWDFRNCTLGGVVKSRKTTQKFFDCLWTGVNFVEELPCNLSQPACARAEDQSQIQPCPPKYFTTYTSYH